MKNLKIRFTAFGLMALFVLSLFMTSCEQEVVTTPEVPDVAHQQMEVVSSDVLTEDDIKVEELKTIVDSEVADMGTPHFDAVTFITYSQPGSTALILPFTTADENSISWLISYFKDGEYANSIFIAFDPTEEYVQEVAADNTVEYSGTFTIYAKTGEVAVRSVIEKGNVIETYENTELRGCLSSCIEWYINQLPWYLQWPCKSSLFGCVIAIVGGAANPAAVACGVIVGCIGGSLWNCIQWC